MLNSHLKSKHLKVQNNAFPIYSNAFGIPPKSKDFKLHFRELYIDLFDT